MKKRVLSLLLAVLLLANCLSMTATAASGTPYTKGAEAGGNYTISTADQLKALAETVNSGESYANTTFTLTQDIDLNGSESNQWTPIGRFVIGVGIYYFSGVFDGGDHKLSGLYINNKTERNGDQGLFCVVGESGTVKNLTVSGSVTGYEGGMGWDVGSIAGQNEGIIENCHFIGDVTHNAHTGSTGGVVGSNFKYGTVRNCSHTGTVRGTTTGFQGGAMEYCYNNTGGVVGSNYGTVENCYNAGNVIGDSYVGGIAGDVSSVVYYGRVTNCYNTGNVTVSGKSSDGSDSEAGGIVGYNGNIVENCYSTGTVTGFSAKDSIGGIAGKVGSDSTTANCYYLTGKVTGGINGKDISGQAEKLTADAFKSTSSFKNWDFSRVWEMGKDSNGNDVRPILKSIKEENLKAISSGGNSSGDSTGSTGSDDTKEPTVSDFKDVPATEYYYNAVDWAVQKGIVSGTSNTTFSPEQNTTRGQIVSFLWRAAGRPEPKTLVNPFTDVKESNYFYKAVLWGYENKIVAGTSDTTFSPNQKCTRAQTVTFLYRYNGSPAASGSGKFTDVPSDEYYANAVAWATANKIVYGTSDDKFSPENTCTRAQSVTFLYRNLAE